MSKSIIVVGSKCPKFDKLIEAAARKEKFELDWRTTLCPVDVEDNSAGVILFLNGGGVRENNSSFLKWLTITRFDNHGNGPIKFFVYRPEDQNGNQNFYSDLGADKEFSYSLSRHGKPKLVTHKAKKHIKEIFAHLEPG